MVKTVLIYSTAYLPAIGGAERAIEEITARLSQSHRFVLVTARLSRTSPRLERIGAVDIIRVGVGVPFIDKLLLATSGARVGAQALSNKPADVVWASMASYGGLAALGYKEKCPSAHFLLTLQEGDEFTHIARRARWIKKRFRNIFIRADAIQAISQYLARWAESMGATVPIVIVPNGVDVHKFTYRHPHVNKKDIQLITTSRLVKKNAVDDTIRSLVHLPDTVTLTIVGDGVERKNLEALTGSLNLSSRVEFVGAKVSAQIPQILSQADIFVRPSLSEGLGNSFLEAFAVGLPVIATPVGGISDFLIDGETGWFAEVRNPESIASCVRYISDSAHSEHVQRVTTTARTLVERVYTWDVVTESIRQLLS